MIHLTTVKVSKNKWVITPSHCVDKHKTKSPLHDDYLDGFLEEVKNSMLVENALLDIHYDRIGREFGLTGLGKALGLGDII